MTDLLVDTHVALWWAEDPGLLSRAGRDAIEGPGRDVFVSAVSVAEIAIKTGLGKLRGVPADLPDTMRAKGFRFLDLSPEHAWRLRDLPLHHRDPFDRMLIAQALHEELTVVTADGAFAGYPGLRTIW